MTASEAARHDLYNGLSELLGPQRAETLMAALPAYALSDLATKADLAVLRTDLHAEIAGLRAEFKTDLTQGLAAVNARIDRLFLAEIGGLIVILGAMVGLALLP